MNEQTTDELLKNVLAALAVIIMTRPLALTDHQLAEVQRAARTLPPSQREHFLEALAHRLGAEPSDEALAQAICHATGAINCPRSCVIQTLEQANEKEIPRDQ